MRFLLLLQDCLDALTNLTASVYIVLQILWYRYFLLNDEGKKTEEQTGTVRTNCIDCLDRTNVTQVHAS
jgi:hypothetical protein